MVGVKTSLDKEPQSVRAVPAEVKDGWSSNPLIHLLMNGKEKSLIRLGANKVPCRMIRNHDRIRASAKLGVGKSYRYLLEPTEKLLYLFWLSQRPNQKILDTAQMI